MSRFLCFFALLSALALTPARAAAAPVYRPPVNAPVVDGFRLPDGPYGAGNRGLEYATSPGAAVHAIGDGLVVFAGPVAGSRYVTVLHPDGLRSSYSYLAEVRVIVGQRVVIGERIGIAGETFHLGVRSGGTYLDPASLFTATGVHLVPLAPDPGSPPAVRDDRGAIRPGTWAWLTAGTLARRS